MRIISTFLIGSIAWILWIVYSTNTNDWLNEAFDRSHHASQNPYSSDVEADDLFNTNIGVQIWWNSDGGLISAWFNDSVIVRFARFLMRFGIVLAVPMILYSAIRIALAFWDEWKLKEALQHVWRVLWWIVLILTSVALVLLITSLARNSVWLFSAWL